MKKRNLNCDILRILVFIFVISVHCLSYIGFYTTSNNGPIMFGLNIIRCLFMTCVPLFVILTGYLMNKKELNKKYIKKISRIIVTYILCSIACLICLKHRATLSIKDYILSILSFKALWLVCKYVHSIISINTNLKYFME